MRSNTDVYHVDVCHITNRLNPEEFREALSRHISERGIERPCQANLAEYALRVP